MNSINLPPYAPILIESTRAIGYSLESAVADIIDNSIAASSACVDIYFFPIDDAYIAVLDDGCGMDAAQINTAMQYGSRSPSEERGKNDLGRFGLGLKTASLSQCRALSVISKQNNRIEGRRWDIDHVIQTGEWSLLILDEDDLAVVPQIHKLYEKESGTLIVWQKLDRLMNGEPFFEQTLGKKMDSVREHLGLVFHRYLSGETGIKKLTININDAQILAADPFILKKSTQAMDDETIIVRGHKIIIRPYILPHLSKLSGSEIASLGGKDGLRRQQGFYVYRNKRLLIWGTWFRMMRQGELSKLARIQVDIPNALDDLWTLDIKKSSAIPPAEVRSNLEVVIERMAERSKRTWTYRGRKETDDSIIHIWQRFNGVNGGVFYEINRDHPLVERIIEEYPHVKQSLEVLLKQTELSIPLNQLYVDLNSDKQIENDTNLSVKGVEDLLAQLLIPFVNTTQRTEMLDRLEKAEPFVHYPDIIKRFREKEQCCYES
jgi:hypothetical protein